MQQVIDTFLYHARAIDTTILTAMNSISAGQTTDGIKKFKKRINHFLNYASAHPDARIKYVASDMHLWSHSDAS